MKSAARVVLALAGLVFVQGANPMPAPLYGADKGPCKKVTIPIDNSHTCDVGIPTCTECPGKKIEYLACGDCKCGESKKDCVWNDWGTWGQCSMGALVDGDCLDCPDCCNGVKMRERTIKTPAECGGMPCNGSDKEIEACGQDCKPPGCSWETWGDWSACSKKCGGGQKYRKRKMVGSKKATTTCCNKDLAICDGPSIEWCGCNTQCCSGSTGCLCADGGCDCGVCMKGALKNPQDCAWDNWSDWLGNCKSKNCGAPGALTRTREIKTFALDGGKPCCGESREVKPCGGDACGHDCKYGDWTDWSGCTESCGGGQKYRHRDITFEPNKKDMGGKPCAPKQDNLCPASCYVPQKVDLAGEGACPCIEKKTTQITCKAPKVGTEGTTEVSETAGCNLGDCKCFWKDWTPWSGCSKKCGGGYKVRCKMQGCASEAVSGVTDYGDAKLKAALDPCDKGNSDLPDCGASGWCSADEWGEATCECDTGKFFIQDMNEKTKVKGVCVTKDSFDTFMSDKFSVESEVVQPVKMSGLVGLQVNDAESVLTETAQKMLNVPTADVRAYYKDYAHLEDEENTNEHPQKMFLQDAPARFEINVQCTGRGQGCSLVQMELLQALRDKKTDFNSQFRKASGKETAYVAAAGLPAVLSLASDVDELAAAQPGASTNAQTSMSPFLALVAGVAMTTLGFVTFLKLKKRQVIHEDNARTPMQQEMQ